MAKTETSPAPEPTALPETPAEAGPSRPPASGRGAAPAASEPPPPPPPPRVRLRPGSRLPLYHDPVTHVEVTRTWRPLSPGDLSESARCERDLEIEEV